jgi:TPR repeat protein
MQLPNTDMKRCLNRADELHCQFISNLSFWLMLLVISAGCGKNSTPNQTANAADRTALSEVRSKAEKGDATSQFRLGLELAVAKDYQEAAKWYRKAAEQNCAEAQSSLGFLYMFGSGVEKDEVEGAKWFRKAAEQNLAEAQGNLSVCYLEGKGVAKDIVESYKWAVLAGSQWTDEKRRALQGLEDTLTPEQIAEGQKRARDFKPR